MSTKKGLGKGLGALFSVYDDEPDQVIEEKIEKKAEKATAKETKTVKETKEVSKTSKGQVGEIVDIEISKIHPNPNQPRKNFDETALNELAASIKIHGIIQPIVINEEEDGYMIIAGERRWRAAQIAKLSTIPAYIKKYTEKQIKEISIIENLQREDLNPIEAAKAIKQLMDEYNLTQEHVADRIGKSRPAITNTLRLLTLPSEVISLVESNKLSAGNARCLVSVPDTELQIKLANYVVQKKLSVRDVEKLVKRTLNPQKGKQENTFKQSIELKEMISEMQRVFATKVSAIGNDRKGRIYIDYYSKDDLDRICELLDLIKHKTLTLQDLNNYNKRK